MKIENSKQDKYGYKLIDIRPFEFSIKCAGETRSNNLKYQKGLSAEYINYNFNKNTTIKFPYMKPNIFNKLRLKKYLSSKNFIEVLAENIFNVFENPSVNLTLTNEEIKDLMELLPHETKEEQAMSSAIFKCIMDTQLKNKDQIEINDEESSLNK